MFELISTYYGIDLLAMILTLVGIYLLGNKNKYGFVVHIFGNALWFALGIMTQSV